MTPEIESYILSHYRKLMTLQEVQAYAVLSIAPKSDDDTPDERRITQILEKRQRDVVAVDKEARELVDLGLVAFRQRVVERLLSEHSDSIFINLCVRCGTLARTPLAKQCPKCFYSWR